VLVRALASRDTFEVLDGISAATASGEPWAVLDPAWPPAQLETARMQLDEATATGRLRPGDLVTFTSGSTDEPRGVVRTVASWDASVAPLTAITDLTADDMVWLPGALSSSLFLYGAWHARCVGAAVAPLGTDPGDATVVHCVPAQLDRILDDVTSGRAARLRLAVVAGDRLPDRARAAAARCGVRLVEYYGAAELSFVAYRDDDGPLRAFPGVEIDLRDGRLWARSAYLATGYLAGDGPMRRDDAGWASVGDLAERVGGGWEVLGRGNTAVTTGGHTVVVEEVERVLRALPGVVDAGVVGLPDARLGQLLVAVVALEEPLDDAWLRGAVRHLPVPARPVRWLRAEALPRTAGGKLRRPELGALAATLAGR
jgi:acyl-coenzyme A synthetase/AMP-(fatty) acid ligase